MIDRSRRALALAALAVAALFAAAVQGQSTDPMAAEQAKRQIEQPLNNAPVWKEVRSGQVDAYVTTQVRGRETNVLINAEGQKWRQFRNGPVTLAGGALLVLVAAAIALFYRRHGTLQLHEAPSGRLIRRFSEWQRTIHWTTAISFVILGISGLIMLFGKHVLLPVLGYTLFSWLARISITLHNFIGPVFFVAVILLFFTFLSKNGWRAHDLTWIKRGGGLASGEHVPSEFFNAGEKLWFWGGVTLLGLVVGLSGFVLNFANFDQTRNTMHLANMVHSIGALLFVTGSFGHIYMGTLGMAGAFQAMKTGYVDETWAEEHHEYWYNETRGKSAAGAGVPQAAGVRA